MKGLWRVAALCAAFLAACGDGGVQSPDFTPELVGLQISPGNTLRIGETQQFTATGTFTREPGSEPATATETVTPHWRVDDESVATINGDGLLTALDAGTVTVTGELNGLAATAIVTVREPDLLSIEITPATASINDGETQTFTATGTFNNGPGSASFTGPVSVSWSSSAPSVASITSSGVATGLTVGTTTITATRGAIVGSATLTVTELPVLISISVSPAAPSIPLGDSIEFIAEGHYETPSGVTSTGPVEVVSWSVASSSIATIDASRGIATGVAQGTTEIRATSGSVTGTASLTVTAPVLREVVLTPESASVPAGASQMFQARGIYSNSATPRVIDDGTVTWAISPGTSATLSATTGADVKATTTATGSETITASVGDLSDSAELTITAAELSSLLRVTPEVGRVIPGSSQEFRVIGGFTDGSEVAINDSNVVWTSSDHALATIDSDTGVATGVAEGEVTITATLVAGYAPSLTERSATAELIIANAGCPVPLLASDNATTGSEVSIGCLFCSVQNEHNVIDSDEDNFATFSVPVGLLGANANLTVAAGETDAYALPFPAGSRPGFVVSHEEGELLTVELLSQISVTTLLNSTPQETSDTTTPLRLDLLGTNLLGEDVGLLSFEATKPYNAIRLTFASGVVTALSSLHVSSACGTAVLPPPIRTLVEVLRVEPEAEAVLVDSTVDYVLIGLYDDGSEGPIPSDEVNWTSSSVTTASIGGTGTATGLAVGETTITGTLKADASPGVTMRSADTTLTVVEVEGSCTTQLVAAKGARTETDVGGLCVLCSVADADLIIDESIETAGTINLPVGLLQGEASVTVSLAPDNDYELPFPGGSPAGFIISRPEGLLLAAEIGSQLTVETLRNGIVQESSEDDTLLKIDLLGTQLIGDVETDRALATIATTQPFDSLRLRFSAGVATLLTNVQVNAACATAASFSP